MINKNDKYRRFLLAMATLILSLHTNYYRQNTMPIKALKPSVFPSKHVKNVTTDSLKENKDERHIKFTDNIKYFYFDWNQPVTSFNPRELKLIYLNPKIEHFTIETNNDDDANTKYIINEKVCGLESFKLSSFADLKFIKLEGHVLVKNFTFKKTVTIRYTLRDWKTFSDLPAYYIDSYNKEWDRFLFIVKVDSSMFTNTDRINLSIAIRYEHDNHTHWDNNNEENHQFSLLIG